MPAQPAPSAPRPSERIPPYSEEAEKAVLGSALLDAARVVDLCVERRVMPEAFYVYAHQVIFEQILAMNQDGRPIDLLTLGERLKTAGRLEQVGGTAYLDSLIDSTPTASHAEYYTGIVHEKHLLRTMIDRARETIDSCYTSEEDADTILNHAEEAFFSISEDQQNTVASWPDLVKEVMEEIENIYRTKQGGTGIPTGFRDLDRILLGMKNADMIILAARPSMGKTALALNIAERVALSTTEDPESRPVAVFSLEMSSVQLVRRMLCCHARVGSNKLTGGYIGDVPHADLTQAAAALSKAPLHLDDTAGLSALELRSRARRMAAKHNIQLIVVDYLQMMNYPQYAKEGRQREVAAISGAMKAMAKELNVPVLMLSQLSRAPETRDRRAIPRLSDLRDSGSIEQDADVVCLLRRPCKYAEDEDMEDKTLAILDVAKHRNGQTGEVKLHFEEEFTRFENRAHGVDDMGEPAFAAGDGGFG
jgi:replicative DNA helicase